MKARLVLEAKPKNVSLARDWVFESCRHFGIKGRRLMDVKTITSEIVTNVARHAYSKNKQKNFVLTLRLTFNNKLVITVRDFGAGFSRPRTHSLHVGLLIVRSLADKVRIHRFGFVTQVKVVVGFKEPEIRKQHASVARLIGH